MFSKGLNLKSHRDFFLGILTVLKKEALFNFFILFIRFGMWAITTFCLLHLGKDKHQSLIALIPIVQVLSLFDFGLSRLPQVTALKINQSDVDLGVERLFRLAIALLITICISASLMCMNFLFIVSATLMTIFAIFIENFLYITDKFRHLYIKIFLVLGVLVCSVYCLKNNEHIMLWGCLLAWPATILPVYLLQKESQASKIYKLLDIKALKSSFASWISNMSLSFLPVVPQLSMTIFHNKHLFDILLFGKLIFPLIVPIVALMNANPIRVAKSSRIFMAFLLIGLFFLPFVLSVLLRIFGQTFNADFIRLVESPFVLIFSSLIVFSSLAKHLCLLVFTINNQRKFNMVLGTGNFLIGLILLTLGDQPFQAYIYLWGSMEMLQLLTLSIFFMRRRADD